ncbi:MAG: LysM peptidoglycan-binding domain-containing protein [Flavobacteriales bacterium]|nr:LysM peptidoglycan-binding domain-containing protein [Flavobacteriales bacterium]
MRNFLFISLFSISFSFVAANTDVKETDSIRYSIAADDAVLIMIDSLMADRMYNCFRYCELKKDSLFSNEHQELLDSSLSSRLQILDNESPFELVYNQYTRAFINLYVNKRRKLSSSVLGLAPLYFPMIEEVLDRYNMPLELKYLAVVESALNPSARSRVGAQGLWQFMYRTGKMYDLKVNSYKDDRMNPYKATVAACEYMSDLYKLYGDWNLVLAAYNSGPGNVNKAIRRSGGHKDYWKIRPFLPRETRGYVPAFIAENYMMSYSEEHDLFASNTMLYDRKIDTVEISRAISFKQLANYINVSEEELKFYNPMYRLNYIPETEESNTLCLPVDKIGVYLQNERAIYADIRRVEILDSLAGKKKKEIAPEQLVHRVRSGEFLGSIANKYKVSVRNLMAWNNLRSTRLNPGDRLTIYSKGSRPKRSSRIASTSKPALKNSGTYKVHVVKRGDTLWDIAKMYSGTSVNELKKLNSNLNFKRLKPGMKVKVRSIG